MSTGLTQAVVELSKRHGAPSKAQVGRIFIILKHNYLVGFSRDDILKNLASRKLKGESLQEIFNTMGFFDLQNKKDAKTLSLMVTDTDQWAVRFAEILLKDRQTTVEMITKWEIVDQVGILILFFVQYGFNTNAAKKLAWLVAAGVVVSEGRAYSTASLTVGTGPIIYTMGGHLVRRLISQRSSTRGTIQLFIFAVSIASAFWIDPPNAAVSYTGGVYTDHLGRALGFLAGWFLPI